ncbi:MAG: serine/threonine protein kinase [Labilithrix sp.]|nr:serine/threonine protein kinase [Labilithrix sp.]MBX3222883.1 serine/threonine protein kinase [Labilithrix sp.]
MPALVREGEVFAGKYRVERILGEGGHGLVFAARSLELDERVAIKLLKRLGTDATTAERFLREARAAIRIRGDGVARVYAVDELDGDLFMVMEYLEGHDLRREVMELGVLAVGDAVDCILQVCDVLGRAHGMGIIHRDIKSANLFSVARPDGRRQIKVLDFGIARSLDPVEASLTQAPQMIGSPHYMAPEQVVDGRTVDERTDIWGLGATLFELLAGVTPFGGGTMLQLLLRLQTQPPDDLRLLRPEVPAELERVVLRCLEKDRAHRFPDVGSLSAALAPFARIGADLTVSSMRADASDASDLDPTVNNAPAKAPPRALPAGAPATASTVRSAGATVAAAAAAARVEAPGSTVRSADHGAPPPRAEDAPTRRARDDARAWPPLSPMTTAGPAAATAAATRSAPATASRATAPVLLVGAMAVLLGVVAVMKLRGAPTPAAAGGAATTATAGDPEPAVAAPAATAPLAMPAPGVAAEPAGTAAALAAPTVAEPAPVPEPAAIPERAAAADSAAAPSTPRAKPGGRATALSARPPRTTPSTPLPDDRQ